MTTQFIGGPWDGTTSRITLSDRVTVITVATSDDVGMDEPMVEWRYERDGEVFHCVGREDEQ